MKILIDGIYKSTCYNGFLIWHFEAFQTDLSVFGLATDVKKIKQTHVLLEGKLMRGAVPLCLMWIIWQRRNSQTFHSVEAHIDWY